MELRRKSTFVWLAHGDFRGGLGGQTATQMGIHPPYASPRATTSKLGVGSFSPSASAAANVAAACSTGFSVRRATATAKA